MSHAQSWIMRALWVFLWILEWNHTISPPSFTIFLTSTALVPTTRPGRRGGGAKKAAASRPSKGWGKHNFSKEKSCHDTMPWHAMTFWVLSTYRMSHNPFIHPWAYRFAHLEYLRFPPTLPKRLHLVLYRRIERSGALSAAGPTHVTFHIHQIDWFH